jgi:hypothetical protein
MNDETLLVIPCCKSKVSGGKPCIRKTSDPLESFISAEDYTSVLQVRDCLNESRINTELFMPSIDRYDGSLYRATQNLAYCMKENTNHAGQPRLIILSALYGPLHPLSPINNYELKMPTTKNSPWFKYFPFFLQDYVEKNGISSIRIYCGLSTGYYKVLKNAIKPLLKTNSLTEAIHYNIVGGNSYHTPHNHGLQLAKDLSCGEKAAAFTKPIEIRYITTE